LFLDLTIFNYYDIMQIDGGNMDCIFGVDIGGTEIKIGKFYQEQLILKTTIKTDVSNNGKNIFPDLFRKLDELKGEDTIVGIGVGVPGPVVNGEVEGAQNLGWKNLKAEEIIREYYPNVIARVLNDANAAAIGEMAAGSAKQFHDFVFVTLGTGIGGGIVINNKLFEGNNGSAGEIGHTRVAENKQRKCNCGLYDCVERYASATGVVITANELRVGRETKLNECEVTSKNIFSLAKENDEVALLAVNIMIEKLAWALASTASVFNPEAFVIGGGVSKAGTFLIDNLRKKFKEVCYQNLVDTKFVLASLGNDAGIYGMNYEIRKQLSN
jgi:glucokinase